MCTLMIGCSIYNSAKCKNVLSSVLQVETSLLRLFSIAIWGFEIIKHFSSTHKVHHLLTFEYALAFARIFHKIVNFSFFSFNSHRYLLSSVSLRFFRAWMTFDGYVIMFWIRWLWAPHVSFFSLVVTVAWYTISFCKHFSSNGQSFWFLQWHVFTVWSCSGCLAFLKVALLCLSMTCFMVGVQL